jgi:O-antigen ligase
VNAVARVLSQTNTTSKSPVVVASADQPLIAEPKELNLTYLLLWCFVFEAFVRLEDIFPFVESLHLVMICGIGATLTYVAGLITGSARFQWSRELVLVLMLTAWFTLGIPFAYWRGGSLHLLSGQWFRTLLFFFLLTQTLTTVGRVRKIVWAVLLSELIASVASLLVQHNSAYDVGGRFAGINKGLLGWNFLGITLTATLPFIAYLYVSNRSVVRTILLIATLGSSAWMLVLIASRGSVFGIIVSLLLTWWFILRGTPRSRRLIVIVGLCLIVAVAKAPPVFWERLTGNDSSAQNQSAETAADSTKERTKLLQDSIEDTLRFPVFGLGIGNFPAYHGSQGVSEGWLGPHNTFTQISAEAGVPALLLFVLLIGSAVQHMKRVSDDLIDEPTHTELRLLARATLVSTLAFAFSGFFAHLAYDYLFYYVIGIATAIWTIAKQKGDEPSAEVPPPTRTLAQRPAGRRLSWR